MSIVYLIFLNLIFTQKYAFGESDDSKDHKESIFDDLKNIKDILLNDLHDFEKKLKEGFFSLVNSKGDSTNAKPEEKTDKKLENPDVSKEVPKLISKRNARHHHSDKRSKIVKISHKKQCVDQLNNCQQIKKLNVCKTSKSSMEKLCRKTCHFCDR
ncbi:hypothetical protein RF11_08528 [Thelohanellus kitauei]|uniref:ShKT domain-containing protein n=1 Tax=Thelohanellus kitauei TaxID=669202 RepID=A0A0C2IXG1_THEKT|nr:hypothetical protein RF11_08528 [Thelohanellus kitauei]